MHRQLKLENILIDETSQDDCKITGFNSVHSIEKGVNEVIGNRSYMPPEMVK